jgi:hypothetical protein
VVLTARHWLAIADRYRRLTLLIAINRRVYRFRRRFYRDATLADAFYR